MSRQQKMAKEHSKALFITQMILDPGQEEERPDPGGPGATMSFQADPKKPMEGLFKIDKIDGKGFGWIALRDIKPGTLIYEEKHQFVVDGCLSIVDLYPLDLMNSFYAMSENDQKEFLGLSNAFLDLNSLPNLEKDLYLLLKNVAQKFVRARQAEGVTDSNNEGDGDESDKISVLDYALMRNESFDVNNHEEGQVPFDSNLVLKIFCIFQTNSVKCQVLKSQFVGIKVSRINHSCIPNSHHSPMGQVRATEKILEGQEITITYGEYMKNVKERQKFFHKFGFVCSCELCQEEEIENDDETYEKFQNLKEEAENSYANFCDGENQGKDKLENLDQIKKALSCQKQMFNLARIKKAPKKFIYDVMDKAFKYGMDGYYTRFNAHGYCMGMVIKNHGNSEQYFKEELEKLSAVGYQIAKMVFGKENSCTKEWKERKEDFEDWFQKFMKKEVGRRIE